VAEERRCRRRVRVLTDLTAACLMQDASMTLGEAVRMVHSLRGAILRLFPGSGRTFDLIVRPRFERILAERWGVVYDRRED
jgi:hypothetical protein